MHMAPHTSGIAALRDAQKQRYFLPHPEDKKAVQDTSEVLHDIGVHHDPICLRDLHSDLLLGASTTPTLLGAIMSEALREDLTMPSPEPVLVASPTVSDSSSSTPALVQPKDTSSALPSKSTLDKAANLPVVDAQGQAVPFNELYRVEPGQRRRVMIIFIRHFFCGNCQEFLRTLVAQLPLATFPTNKSIIIIGCGSHTLIPSYAEVTSCPYPIYADATKKLFDLLGMKRTLSLGWHAPNYIHHSLATGVVKSIVQSVKRLPEGDMLKAGDLSQNGGEYLFEVEGRGSRGTRSTKQEPGYKSKGNNGLKVTVTFCHRMQNSRDHTEIPQLVQLLGFSEGSEKSRRVSSRLERRWTSGDRVGNLARSLSNRRPSWLERRNSSSWSVTRRRDRSESSNPGDTGKRSPEEIGTLREDGMCRFWSEGR